MQVDLRMPNITGTDREQLSQIRSYLYQFIPQLQWALNSLDTSASSNYVVQQAKANSPQQQSSSPEVSFNDLKALIIKSADIVEAYYEEIHRRLSGLYVAESDFGTYKQETELKIKENSEGVTQYYLSKQQIDTDIEGLKTSLKESQGYIKTGILDYDTNTGHAIIGVEILQGNSDDGEKQGNKLARFTSERLSFYDPNDNEVAYISDYKLFICNAEITTSLKIGGFVDTVSEESGDVVTRWEGWG